MLACSLGVICSVLDFQLFVDSRGEVWGCFSLCSISDITPKNLYLNDRRLCIKNLKTRKELIQIFGGKIQIHWKKQGLRNCKCVTLSSFSGKSLGNEKETESH